MVFYDLILDDHYGHDYMVIINITKMECSAEHVYHLHLLIESVTDRQTDGQMPDKKNESLSAYHATQGDTKRF